MKNTLASLRVYAVLFLLGLVSVAAVEAQSVSSTGVPGSQAGTASRPDLPPTDVVEFIQGKQWKQVAAVEEEKLQTQPTNVSSIYWLGIARLQLHDLIGAAQALRKAQVIGPDFAALHLELGHAYYGLNQFFLFQQQMQLASNLEPKNPDPKYFLGLYHLTVLSDVNGALLLFREATALRSDDWKSLYQLGHCLELNGQPDEAKQTYLRDIQLIEQNHDRYGWPYQGMARLLIDENPQEALRFAKLAIEIEPGEYSNHFTLAKVYEHLGNREDAITQAQIAVNQNPTDASLRYFLFVLYRRAGNGTSAESELATFKKLNEVYGSD